MLVVRRAVDESIMIGKNVEVMIFGIKGGNVRVGIRAPNDVQVHRKEVFDAIERKNRASTKST